MGQIKSFLKLFTPIHIFIAAWLLVALAAFSNAAMDTIVHHWDISVIQSWSFPSQHFWKPDWTKMYDENGEYITWFWFIKAHPMFYDGWHFLKVIMLGSLLASGMFAQKRLKINLRTILFYLLFGITSWVLMFNLFYDNLLVY